MVKISVRYDRKLKRLGELEDLSIWPPPLSRPQTCVGHFHVRAQNWCKFFRRLSAEL